MVMSHSTEWGSVRNWGWWPSSMATTHEIDNGGFVLVLNTMIWGRNDAGREWRLSIRLSVSNVSTNGSVFSFSLLALSFSVKVSWVPLRGQVFPCAWFSSMSNAGHWRHRWELGEMRMKDLRWTRIEGKGRRGWIDLSWLVIHRMSRLLKSLFLSNLLNQHFVC